MAELKSLGRYTIERVLGKGAMGVVYEAVDPRLNRRVAIKTILRSSLDEATAQRFAARFVQEAQAVARLNHPHIVQVHDFGEEGEVAYIVMEFIRGRELKAFFDTGERFDLKEAVRIMGELCEALDFAHQAGIVHRDVKPGNVMLDTQSRVKLTDFGVARMQDVTRTHATQEGTMVGTPAYMSPEQISGTRLDRRTDVFSAGIVLYQFLTGDLPWSGGAWTIARKIMQDPPPRASAINAAVPPLFDAVVSKALAKNPDERYQSAKDFSIALKRALEGKPFEDDADRTIVAADPVAPPPQPVQDAEVEFWRAIKDGTEAEDFELYLEQFPNGTYAKLARRKVAKLRGTGAGTGESTTPEREVVRARRRTIVLPIVLGGIVIALIWGAAWLALRIDTASSDDKRRMAELEAKLEESKKREDALAQSRAREAELKREAQVARQREAEAKKAGDLARQKEMLEQARQREAAARKQAELTRQREAELARLQAERKKLAEAKAEPKKAVEVKAEPKAAPPPAPIAAPPVVAAVAAPVAAPAPRFPQAGDRFAYTLIDREIRDRPQQSYVATVTAASPGGEILEDVVTAGSAAVQGRHGKDIYVLNLGVSVLSPYLAAFRSLEPGGTLGAVNNLDIATCRIGWACTAAARIVGRERVQVPAGSFDTVKVELVQTWYGGHFRDVQAGRRVLTVWYTPLTRRAVKFSNRESLTSGYGPTGNFDLELTAYQPK